jgi:hypothetical protein
VGSISLPGGRAVSFFLHFCWIHNILFLSLTLHVQLSPTPCPGSPSDRVQQKGMLGLGQKRAAFFCNGKVAPDAELTATDAIRRRRVEACILGKECDEEEDWCMG